MKILQFMMLASIIMGMIIAGIIHLNTERKATAAFVHRCFKAGGNHIDDDRCYRAEEINLTDK